MQRYLEIEPWTITERGFHPDRAMVSESIFSLANEYMGIRGIFDEGYSGDTLIGAYFNGVFDEHPHIYPNRLSGFPVRNHFMTNAVNWLYTRIRCNGEELDLNKSSFGEFERTLDLREGIMRRSFVWEAQDGIRLRCNFLRLLSMDNSKIGGQRIRIESLQGDAEVNITLSSDFSPPHVSAGKNLWNCLKKGKQGDFRAILGETLGSHQKIVSLFEWRSNQAPASEEEISPEDLSEKLRGVTLIFKLTKGQPLQLDRLVLNEVEKNKQIPAEGIWDRTFSMAGELKESSLDSLIESQRTYWSKIWEQFDIDIEGDPANAQGTRYCIYQLLSTFHGVDPSLNIGAKGLTGEAYGGLAFWDTEAYCLPFYLFTNPSAAKNLLLFRYNTLPQARERARELDCEGARYPMTTIDGTECCGVWHHGDIEIHVPAAVAFGVWYYVHITGDRDFLFQYGAEMLIEISRFYASHGEWSPKTGEFGLWGVMGADEFHMMVHNNAYTNTMAKKTFEWALDAIEKLKQQAPETLRKLESRLQLRSEETDNWKQMAAKMRLQRNPDTGLIEQHDGYFDLPHMDLQALPPEKKPVCSKFPYIKRSRYDWIKQPDVLLLHFFFSHDYPLDEKRINYEFYEPKCTHESSLSPGIHSILATELGMHDKAFEYVKYASRLDIDDYNGNTEHGLHMTSMAAAWMSLVFGFGGMRTDGEYLSFQPSIPKSWKSYRFHITYRDALIEIRVDRKTATFKRVEGPAVDLRIFGELRKLTSESPVLEVALPTSRIAE